MEHLLAGKTRTADPDQMSSTQLNLFQQKAKGAENYLIV